MNYLQMMYSPSRERSACSFQRWQSKTLTTLALLESTWSTAVIWATMMCNESLFVTVEVGKEEVGASWKVADGLLFILRTRSAGTPYPLLALEIPNNLQRIVLFRAISQ